MPGGKGRQEGTPFDLKLGNACREVSHQGRARARKSWILDVFFQLCDCTGLPHILLWVSGAWWKGHRTQSLSYAVGKMVSGKISFAFQL